MMHGKTNTGKIILSLRNSKGLTQEELADKLNISAQAISKWENDICLPDTYMLPLIADHFNVSVDYLFNGDTGIKDKSIQEAVCDYIASFGQFKGYKQALELLTYIHSGLTGGRGHINSSNQCISHISDANGLSILGVNQGYGVFIERDMFQNVSRQTFEYAQPVLNIFSDHDKIKILTAIISMDSISYNELSETTELENDKLRGVLDDMIGSGIVIEKKSKHKQLGTEYQICDMQYVGICVLLATFEIMRQSMSGITCFLGFGDYPIKF